MSSGSGESHHCACHKNSGMLLLNCWSSSHSVICIWETLRKYVQIHLINSWWHFRIKIDSLADCVFCNGPLVIIQYIGHLVILYRFCTLPLYWLKLFLYFWYIITNLIDFKQSYIISKFNGIERWHCKIWCSNSSRNSRIKQVVTAPRC